MNNIKWVISRNIKKSPTIVKTAYIILDLYKIILYSADKLVKLPNDIKAFRNDFSIDFYHKLNLLKNDIVIIVLSSL